MSYPPSDHSTPAPRYGPRTPTASTRPPTGKFGDVPKRTIRPCTPGLKWINKQKQTSEQTNWHLASPGTKLPSSVCYEHTYSWRYGTIFGPHSTENRDTHEAKHRKKSVIERAPSEDAYLGRNMFTRCVCTNSGSTPRQGWSVMGREALKSTDNVHAGPHTVVAYPGARG